MRDKKPHKIKLSDMTEEERKVMLKYAPYLIVFLLFIEFFSRTNLFGFIIVFVVLFVFAKKKGDHADQKDVSNNTPDDNTVGNTHNKDQSHYSETKKNCPSYKPEPHNKTKGKSFTKRRKTHAPDHTNDDDMNDLIQR
jgi:hypothetical protein